MPQTLREVMDVFWQYKGIPAELPDYVIQNLNPSMPLRPYQGEALARLFWYFNGFQGRVRPAHLLFHIATGSGKTLIMAASILKLYE